MNDQPTFDFPKKLVTSSNQPDFLPKSRIFILLITVLLMTVLLASRFIWKPVLEVNQKANSNIYATKDFVYIDEKATQKAINEVISSISPAPTKNPDITQNERNNLHNLLQKVSDVKNLTKEDSFFNTGVISTDIQNYIFSLKQSSWENDVYANSIDVLARLLAGGYPPDASKTDLQNTIYKLVPDKLSHNNKKAIAQIVTGALKPEMSIYYAAKQLDSSEETRIKREIEQIYLENLNTNLTNKNIFSSQIIKPNSAQVQSAIDIQAYIFKQLEKIQSIKRLNKLVYTILPEDIREPVSSISEEEWYVAKKITINTFDQMLEQGISQLDMANLDDIIQKYVPDSLIQEQKELVFLLINKVATPNVIIDKAEFEKLRKEAVKRVDPVKIKFTKNTLLVKKNEVITPEKMKLLNAAGVLDKQIYWDGVYEIFSLVTFVSFIYILYLYAFEKEVFTSSTYLWLISILLLSTILISDILTIYNSKFIPLAVFSAVIAMFVNLRIAIVSLIFITMLFLRVYDISITTLFTLFAGSIAAAFILPKVNQRINILKGGIIIAFIQVIIYNIGFLITDITHNIPSSLSSSSVLVESLYWMLSGFSFSMIILAILPLIEEVFGLITYSRLTELGDFNQPVLREMEEKAPGTFQHSIAVAALSEYAARKLNLDSTLTRVGSYYHDLGKMLKPEYFIENQLDQINPHDTLNDPKKSAKIIISHARAGITIAKKNKVPPPLMPFITEHHGTSLVTYFYYKAKQQAKNNNEVNEKDYRYFGPKPQSKETAIVMLADSSEAAVRTIKEKNRENIKSKIKDIVSTKINDGQLNESGLTTDEIAIIIEAFTYVVLEFYHNRIEYPSMKK
jgi:hypothetical protein